MPRYQEREGVAARHPCLPGTIGRYELGPQLVEARPISGAVPQIKDAGTPCRAHRHMTSVSRPVRLPRRYPHALLGLRMLCTWTIALSVLGCGGGGGSAETSAAPLSSTGQGASQILSTSQPLATEKAAGAALSPAPGYYVDSVLGDDANDGAIERPWRTLARVSSAVLKAGDGIYLRCGQRWRETLSLNHNQLADGSIVAGYGSECSTQKAAISGADDFSGGWTLNAGVWSRSLPAGTPKISQLFIDSTPMKTAQWPDAGNPAPQIALAVLSASTGAASRQSLGVQADTLVNLQSQSLLGATIQIRTQPWMIETRRVVGQTGSTVQLDKVTDWGLQSGQVVVLQDQRWMLDSPGEFFHDTASQMLYLIAPLGISPRDLNAALVEGSVRDLALRLINRRGMSVRDLMLTATRDTGLRLTDAPGIQVTRVEAQHNAIAGIQLQQWVKAAEGETGGAVTDSLFADNGHVGIDAQYVNGVLVARNRVLATGTGNHHQANVFAAIAAGPAARVEDNQVDGSGYIGIRFSAVGGSTVMRNTVSGYCVRLTDCGAIYTWNGNAYPSTSTESTVEGNRVFGATPLDVVAAEDGSDVIAGVYVDDLSHGVTIRGNTIFGAPTGVLVHNSSRTIVTGNRIWLPSQVGIFASMDDRAVDTMVSNRFEGNQIVPLASTRVLPGALPEFRVAQAFWFWHWRSGAAALAPERNSFINNSVFQLQGPLAAHAWLRGPGDERYIDSQEWQNLNPAEPPVQRPVTFDALQVTTGPELVQNGDFNAGLTSWRTWHHANSTQFSAQPTNSRLGCDGPCISFTSGHGTDLLASQPFQMRTGVPHVYRWKAVMPPNSKASVAYPYISRESSPWDAMWNTQGFVGYNPRQAGAGNVLNYEIFFMPKSADAARVNLQLDTAGVSVGVDSISVREVTGYLAAKVGDWAAVAHAPAGSQRIWSCADFGWPAGCQVAGESGLVAFPLTVPAGGMLFLVRIDSNFASRR